MTRRILVLASSLAGLATLLCASAALAQEGEPTLSPGDTAWMLTSSALVLMMTLPGLALFYGGLVRGRNVLSIFMQCLISGGLASVLWVLFGYGLAFGDGGQFYGSLSSKGIGLSQISPDTLSGTIPEYVFCMW